MVVLVDSVRKLDSTFLSSDELNYVKRENRANKVTKFSFNHLNHWVYVRIVTKAKTPWLTLEAFRKAGDSLLSSTDKHKVKSLTLIDLTESKGYALAFAEGILLGSYQFIKYKKDALDKACTLKEMKVLSKHISESDLQQLDILSKAVFKARDLVNEPVSVINAESLSAEFEQMGNDVGAKVEVLNKSKIVALKMGGIMAVNRGSIDPPTFTILEWKPKDALNKKPLVLVGKGIVYDSGGLSLKPAKSMETMKCDMAGSAMMAGAFYAIASAKLPLHVIALLPATDNRPDGNAYTPGDIIKMYDGSSVEVLNTDAEGRMILADALAYARKYEPMLVINAATLTGSAANAIGHFGIVAMQVDAAGHYDILRQAGDRVHERLVEFPMWEDYADLIKSEIADLKNIGGTFAGMITAGKFLEHFTDYPFIHLDIAGPAFVEKRDSYRGLGGTGVGIRLIFEFAQSLSLKKR